MKKAKLFYRVSGVIVIIAMLCFVILIIYAVVKTIRGDQSGAALCLLWGIAMDVVFSGVRNVAVDRYNDYMDSRNQEEVGGVGQYSQATADDLGRLREGGKAEYLVIMGQGVSVVYWVGGEFPDLHWSVNRSYGLRHTLISAASMAKFLRGNDYEDARVVTTTGATTIY